MGEQLDRVRDYFDDEATQWDKDIEEVGWVGHEVLRIALRELQHPVRTMLDLGAATGTTITVVRERIDPDTIIAVDISAKMLDQLRQKYPDDTKIIIARKAVELFLAEPGEQFDLVTAMGVLPFMSEGLRTIGAIAARLSPGGHVMFTYDPIIFADDLQSEKEVVRDSKLTVYNYSGIEVDAAVRESGLKLVDHTLYRARPTSTFVGGFVVAYKPENE